MGIRGHMSRDKLPPLLRNLWGKTGVDNNYSLINKFEIV